MMIEDFSAWNDDLDLGKGTKSWVHLNPGNSHPSILGDAAIDPANPPVVYRLMEKTNVLVGTVPNKKSSWNLLLSTGDLEAANAYRERLISTEIAYSHDNLEIWPVYIEDFGEGNYG